MLASARSLHPGLLLSSLSPRQIPERYWGTQRPVCIRNHLQNGLREGGACQYFVHDALNRTRELTMPLKEPRIGQTGLSIARQDGGKEHSNGYVTHVQRIEATESLPAPLTGINLGLCGVQSLMSSDVSRKNYKGRIERERERTSSSRTCNRVAEQSPYCTPATRTCTDALPCATSGDLMRIRRQFTVRWAQSVGSQAPLRLNRLVNVLPQPGTGHRKLASFRRRLALAA